MTENSREVAAENPAPACLASQASAAWQDPPRRQAPATSPVLAVDGFEGPLEWLLELARTRKIDLARLSILTLVEAFAAAMDVALQRAPGVPAPDLAQWASWTVMAAQLTELRSRLLLPADAPEARTAQAEAEALRRQWMLRTEMAAAATWLERRPQLGIEVFGRGRSEVARQEAGLGQHCVMGAEMPWQCSSVDLGRLAIEQGFPAPGESSQKLASLRGQEGYRSEQGRGRDERRQRPGRPIGRQVPRVTAVALNQDRPSAVFPQRTQHDEAQPAKRLRDSVALELPRPRSTDLPSRQGQQLVSLQGEQQLSGLVGQADRSAAPALLRQPKRPERDAARLEHRVGGVVALVAPKTQAAVDRSIGGTVEAARALGHQKAAVDRAEQVGSNAPAPPSMNLALRRHILEQTYRAPARLGT